MKISYQGEPGSYSDIAVKNLFGTVDSIGLSSFDEACEYLVSGEVDYAVLPIENSTHGSVYQNYDNITKFDFRIVGEVYVKINFHLIAHPGVTLDQIKTIYSHPVGLNQIKSFQEAYPHIEFLEYSDTAGSVAMIQEEKIEKFCSSSK
ncbi:MAG: hypothetical protein KatS3mg086_002 [Candidatus Dojkabacteria bacterium]|nr:MAG: hypothetical protein KatS3mg086_002 [Candidatus Dojkabacteria bacterium]